MSNSTPFLTSETSVGTVLQRRFRIALWGALVVPAVVVAAVVMALPTLLVVVFGLSAVGLAAWLIAPSWQDWTAWSAAIAQPNGFESSSARISALSHASSGTLVTLTIPGTDGLRLGARGFRHPDLRLGHTIDLQIYPARAGRQVAMGRTPADNIQVFGFVRPLTRNR